MDPQKESQLEKEEKIVKKQLENEKKEEVKEQDKEMVDMDSGKEKINESNISLIEPIAQIKLEKKQESVKINSRLNQADEVEKVPIVMESPPCLVKEEESSPPKIIKSTIDIPGNIEGKIGEAVRPQQIVRQVVKIQVVESIQKGTSMSKYILYRLVGQDKHGPFSVYRKYSQFQSLRQIICQRWPGCFIPTIGNKSDIKKPQERQKHVRRTLTNFLLGLSCSDHLYYREQVQLFLRSPDIDINQMVEEMPVLKSRDVISRYISSFGSEVEGVSQAKNAAIIIKFTAVLRKIINCLGILSSKALTLAQSFDNYATQLGLFWQNQRAYERLSLLQYVDNQREKSILMKDSQNRTQILKVLSYQNPFYRIYTSLYIEARDAQSFLQVIIASGLFTMRKDELDSEIKSLQTQIDQIAQGHKTIKTMTTRKPKQEVQKELQALVKKLTEERTTIVQIFNITEIMLAKKQINIFKQFKRDSYQSVLREWGRVVGHTHPELQLVWNYICEASRQLLVQ